MSIKLTPRDIAVIILIICAVTFAWFVVIAALLKLAFAGYVFFAWLLLLVFTFAAMKYKRKSKSSK